MYRSNSATVTVTEQAKPNAGLDAELTVCEGTTITDDMLYAALAGSPTAGGTWTNVDNVYTYTVAATSPCSDEATATVTVIEQAQPNAGTDGTLTVCEGTVPSNSDFVRSVSRQP